MATIELDINDRQRALIRHYALVDDGVQLLGYHRRRPVLYTYTDPPGQFRGEHRHVVVIQRNGEPGDLPIEIEYGSDWLWPRGTSERRRGTVYAIVREWQARVRR